MENIEIHTYIHRKRVRRDNERKIIKLERKKERKKEKKKERKKERKKEKKERKKERKKKRKKERKKERKKKRKKERKNYFFYTHFLKGNKTRTSKINFEK